MTSRKNKRTNHSRLLYAAAFLLCGFCLTTPGLAQAPSSQLRITGANIPPDNQVLKLRQQVNWSFNVSQVDTTVRSSPAAYLVYATGRDIYGNTVFLEVARGSIPPLLGNAFDTEGKWVVPNDGTLYNMIDGGYQFIIAVYENTATVPTTLPAIQNPTLSRSSRFLIDVVPNLAVASPSAEDADDPVGVGVEYPAGIYRGGDVVQFSVTYFNSRTGEAGDGGRRQSRPLRPGRDRFTIGIGLSSNAEFNTAAYQGTPGEDDFDVAPPAETPAATTNAVAPINDDFKLMNQVFSGDFASRATLNRLAAERAPVPDTFSQFRKVEVRNSGALPVPPHGLGPVLTPVVGTARNYTPQPYDGFLDLGETVTVYTEQLMPDNYAGRYFVVSGVLMVNQLLDSTKGNNTFVSNAGNEVELVERSGSTLLQPVSAITKSNGAFQQGGTGASDFGSISEDGNFIAFASRANNLLISSQLLDRFQFLYGATADPATVPSPPPSPDGGQNEQQTVLTEIRSKLTAGQQIFLRYRQSYENQLASRNRAGQPANADAFNPSISANGLYVAYDSVATNIDPLLNTGARSMIYVFNRETEETVVVSRSGAGQLANGSSFNPSMSASGRFVVFESDATNLDPTRNVPANTRYTQVYLHDRDADQDGVFDETGAIATYLVSINGADRPADGLCFQPVINLNDTAADIAANGGMYVAYVSYARNLTQSTGYAMVYRTRVAVSSGIRGAIATSVSPVSINNAGTAASAIGVDLVGAWIKPDSFEPAINGNGTVVAFSSSATSLVRNERTGTYVPTYPNNNPLNPFAPVAPGVVPAGDFNRVSDVFVRDFNRRTTERVSISEERVATGTITLWALATLGNVPAYQPNPGDFVTISDGRPVADGTATFTFGGNVPLGANIAETCRNLADAINASNLQISAEVTTPPNVGINNVIPGGNGGVGYWASLYLRNQTPGAAGNVPIVVQSTSLTGAILVQGMRGGGRQAEDDALDPGQPDFAPVLGVAYGSWQPSLDREGRLVAFRSCASNLDVFWSDDANAVKTLPPWQPPTPVTGEPIRPLVFPASNVYLHDRDALSTKRVSVSNFGYGTYVEGNQQSGRNANTSANSSAPALSADGRFVVFSTDSEGAGGLIFEGNNLTPRDNTRFRDVMVQDRLVNGAAPVQPDTVPRLAIVSPANGTKFVTGSTLVLSANASAAANKKIATVEFFVNGVSIASVNRFPYVATHLVDAPGTYNIVVTATDNFGVQKTEYVRVTAERATNSGGGATVQAPAIAVTHPSDTGTATGPTNQGGTAPPLRFSVASSFYLNALFAPDATASLANLKFYANGEEVPGTLSQLGSQYGSAWRPSLNTVYSIVAQGSDSFGNTVVSQPIQIEVGQVSRALPSVAMKQVTAAGPSRVGSTLLLAADYASNSSSRVTRVDFYANSVFLSSFTPTAAEALAGQAVVEWIPEVQGTYQITARVLQIDEERGSHSVLSTNALPVTVDAAKPVPDGKTGPVVLLTDPISEPRLVLGSEVYININATDPDDPRGVATNKVSILINGEKQTAVRRYGDTWSVRWKPTQTGLFSIQAVAEDRDGYSSVLPAFRINIVRGLRPLPQVQMLPLDAAAQLNNTTTYKLRARAFFPPQTGEQARVDFYANGVLVGNGFIAQPAGNDGFATYQFDWKPAFTTGLDVTSLRISAKATSRNFFSFTAVENVEQQNQIENYGSTLSNELDPVTVSGVTSATPNQSFVVDLYNKVFYRAPNYGEWKYYVDRLNSGALSQSQVIMEVMGYDPALQKFNYRNLYGQTSGMALAAYYRLKLTPTSDLIQDFVNRSLSDTTLLPLTTYPAPGLAAPPYGATVGMGEAFQEVIDSAAFNRSYRLVRGYSNQKFVAWMRDVVFPRRPLGQLILISGTGGGSTLPPTTSGNTATGRPGQSTNTGNNNANNDGGTSNNASNGNTTGGTTGGDSGTTTGGTTGGTTATAGLMENPTVEGFPQGAGMAFLSRLVLASYSDTEKVFQRQMATTALNFQLSGGRVWDPDLYKRAGYGLFSDAVVRKILSTYPVGTSAATALQARNRQLAGMAGTYRGTIAAGALNSLAGGTIEVTANSKGVVTGALTMNGRAYAFRGAIGQDGKVSAVAQGLPGERSYLLNLSFNAPGTTSARVTGTVNSGKDKVSLTAAVQDNQAVRNARKIQTMAGRYEGVVHRAALNGQAGGSIRINSDAKGAVSGQVRINGRAFSFRGKVDPNGRINARTDAVKGLPRYDLALQMLQPGSASAAHVTGTLSTGKQKATVRAHISPWSTRKTAALYSGKFRLAMNPAPAGRKLAASVPRGPRTAELTVGKDGTVILKGQLGAGAPITWSGRLTGDGRVLLQSPVRANGSVVGTVNVTNRGGRKSVSGALDWTKPPAGKDKGFKLNLAVVPR